MPAKLRNEGFVHCCLDSQLEGVLARYFKDAVDLLLLVIDEGKLKSRVIFEKGPNQDNFPHVYGAINKDAIVEIQAIK